MAQQNSDRKFVSALPAILLMGVMALSLTYGASKVVASATKPKVKTVTVVKKTEVTKPTTGSGEDASTGSTASTSSKSTSSTTATTPAVTPAPAPAVKTATTNHWVNFRLGKSSSSTLLSVLEQGTTVTLGSYSDAKWQQITVNGRTGYVAKQYLTY